MARRVGAADDFKGCDLLAPGEMFLAFRLTAPADGLLAKSLLAWTAAGRHSHWVGGRAGPMGPLGLLKMEDGGILRFITEASCT